MAAAAWRRTAGAALLVLGSGAALAQWQKVSVRRAPTDTTRVSTGFSERATRDQQIRVWHQALAADSTSAIAMGQLAALHLQRAREGGGWEDYQHSEELARRALAQRTVRNGASAATLVSALLAQHRFTEARDAATALVLREPDVPEYRAALAEVAMELGDDIAADSLFRRVWRDRGTLTIAARLARWLELTNRVPMARQLLLTARREVQQRRGIARETQAWFALRVGDLELRAGRFRAAEQAFRQGLQVEPDDPRLLAAMAGLSQARGDPSGVIEWGERAIAVALDPGTLGLVGDAYAARGDRAKADEYFGALQTAVSAQPGAYHRAWSLYLLDHGMQVADVLERAEAELRERKDVYGYDVFAWALEHAGRHAEAQAAMNQALRLKTPDPLLLRHAAAIGVSVRDARVGD